MSKAWVIEVKKNGIYVLLEKNGDAFRKISMGVREIYERKYDIQNAEIVNGDLKGRPASLDRLKYKPLILLKALVLNNKTKDVIGYEVYYNSQVKKLRVADVIALATAHSKESADGCAIANAQIVKGLDKDTHIRNYPNFGDFRIEEHIIKVRKSEKVEEAVRTTKEQKSQRLREVYSDKQLEQLRLGKKAGIDINVYSNPELSHGKMREIRRGLVDRVDAGIFASPKFSIGAMRLLRTDMKLGIDVSTYINPRYDIYQLSELSDGYVAGLEISEYANPNIKASEMAQIRLRMENDMWNKKVITVQ